MESGDAVIPEETLPVDQSEDNLEEDAIPPPEPGEVPVCRVCHGESEPGRELFHPCKCDGTIKFIHQDCLKEWIKHSRQKKPRCELCGTPFHFQNVYKEGAPLRLTLIEMFIELVPRTIELVAMGCSMLVSIFLWLVCLPIFAALVLRFDWCTVSEQVNQTCFERILDSTDTLESITTSWYNGIVTLCVIVTVTFFGFETCRLLVRELSLIEKNYVIRLISREVDENKRLIKALDAARKDFLCNSVDVIDRYVCSITCIFLTPCYLKTML